MAPGRAGLALLALGAALLGAVAGARAQAYPDVRPVPKTTDPAALRATATAREIHERFHIGLAAMTRSDWPAAQAEFARVLDLHPPEPMGSTAHYDLGIVDVNQHDYTAARTEFAAAIKLDDGFIAARANLVTVELKAGDLPAARKSAAELLARAPGSARGLYLDGLAALQAGDAASAVRAFGTMLSHDPSYATAHYDLALAEIQLGRMDEAERELQAALTLAPAYERARFALGTVLLKTGRRDEARTAFEQVARSAQDPELQSLAASMKDALSH